MFREPHVLAQEEEDMARRGQCGVKVRTKNALYVGRGVITEYQR